MAIAGFTAEVIAKSMEISQPTLRKYYRDELENARPRALAQVGQTLFMAAQYAVEMETIFKDILDDKGNVVSREPIGRRARQMHPAGITAAIFLAKTQMGYKETNVNEHTGKDGAPIAVFLPGDNKL
jgi:hypothetical protein